MYSVNLAGVATQSLVSIGTNISSENASIQNASITSLSVVDFKSATFSPHTLNTSNLNVSSITIDPNFVFPVLNVSTLNSIEESFVNVSAVNISANQITADNIQPLLSAGDNISILNNTISALNNNLPATGNFTTLNTSQINASNLSTGDLTFGSNFTLNDKFLTVNSTTNITENSGDLITSGAVYNALNKFSVNISDGRSLTNTKLIAGGDVIKPIIPGTVSSVKTNVDPGTSQNIMKVFYTTKFGPTAILSAVANFGYQVSGFGTDRITARLEYNNGTNNNIGQQEQLWDRDEGGGTRSGVLSPRQGVRQSGVSAGTTVFFQIIIQNDSGDDTFTFLTPDACNFHITESLDNAGSDLNLNTGNLQADEANFNSLTIQEGSGSGQATIGKTYLGNNAFSNMAALSVNGNDGANNYGFAQVSNGNTIMNAMPSSYNSFRSSNNEIASIGDIGLGIALGIGNTAVFPLEVGGSALFSGVVFANEIDTADAIITNISNTNLSGTNATFQEINVSGNLIVNGTTFTTTNLIAGENINISNNVISAFFGSGGQVNLNYIQVDGGVDIGGVLNVSQTSNFSNSVNVGDILYVGESGNHEGSVVLYSNIVGDNLTTKINSSTLEVNCSATGNLSVINFFVGNNKSLEITNSGIEATSIISDIIDSAELTADVLTFIDGRATFRFNTPQMNASNASIDTADIGQINASVVTCDVLETDELDLDVLNVSTLNFSQGIGDQLNTSNLNTSNLYANTGNISSLTIDGTNDFPLVVPNGQVNIRQMNISNALFMEGSDMYVGSALNASSVFGGAPRSRINFWSSTKMYDMGTRMGVNENNEAFLSLEPFGDVNNYTISINNFSTMNMTETDTTFNHRLIASNISSDNLTANTITLDASLMANDMEIMNDVDIYNDLFVANRIDATTVDALDIVGDNGDFGLLESSIIRATTTNTSTINSSNGNFSSLVVNATGSFQSVVANNVNVAGTLNANNIPGYQETLTAGDNISILNNVISAIIEEFPANANFSSITADTANISQVNCSSVNVETKLTANRIIGNELIEVGELGTGGADLIFYGPLLSSKMEMELLENEFNLKSSVDNINFKIDNNVKASITQTGLNANIINTDTITGATFNSSFINTSFFSCIDEAGFSGTLNGNIISCNELDSDEAVIGEIRATNNIRSKVYNISDNLDQSEASVLFRDGNITQLLHSGGRIRFDCNSIETSVGNFSTINASVINGANLSTASIAFSNDFLFDTFSNTLRLAEDAGQAVQDALDGGIVTPSVNTSNLNVDGLTTLDAVSVGISINALTANLNTINSSGTANISVINSSVINGDNLSTASISFNSADFVFSNNELSLVGGGGGVLPANANFSSVNTDVLNASTINSSVINGDNLSTASISFDPTNFNFSNGELSLVGGTGIVTVAIAKISSSGNNVNVLGCSVSRTSTGRYTLTFDTPQPDNDYVVQLTVQEDNSTRDDIIINFDEGSAQTTGFSYYTTENDNGATAGVYRDKSHFVTVSSVGDGAGTIPADDSISGGTNIKIFNNEISTDTNVNFNSVTSSTANITTLTNSKITSTDRIIINNDSPTLYFKDTNSRSGMIHMNSNRMYFLSGGTNSESWSQVGGRWPLILYTDTNTAEFGGGLEINGRSNTGTQFSANENAFDIDAKALGLADALGLRSKLDNYNIVNFYNNGGGNRGSIQGVNSGSIRYVTTSDRRKKEDIVDLDNGLEKVMKLKPRTYRWKEGHELDDGFIAQEVFETFPHFIPTNRFKCDISQNDVYHGKLCSCCNIEKKANGEDYIFGIDYGKFTPYLCKAIQEQQQQIETLKKQYDELLSILSTE